MHMCASNTLRQTIVRTSVVASFSAPVFYEQSNAIFHTVLLFRLLELNRTARSQLFTRRCESN